MEETQEILESENESKILVINSPPQDPREIRALMLYGAIDAEKCAEVIEQLIVLRDPIAEEASADSEAKKVYKPLNFYISSEGGDALDMFAVYDVMRETKVRCEICTVGVGKIMSAAVLLLAGGTKGKRRVGKHCRIMIHGVTASMRNNIVEMKNEIKEIDSIQGQYISALAEETNMTKKYIENLIKKNINVYLTAQEAVELGIADEIF